MNVKTLTSSDFIRTYSDAARGRSRRALWLHAALACVAALFMYVHLFHGFLVPIDHTGDEYIFLDHAERMLHGKVLYRDISQFNLPGVEYLYYFLFRLFGVKIWLGTLVYLLASTGVTLMVYSLSRLVLEDYAALVPATIFLTVCQRITIDATHHWYTTLFILIAIYLAARGRNLFWIGCAGAALALATLFTSVIGVSVAAGVSLYYLVKIHDWKRAFKTVAILLLPFATILTATITYLASIAGTRVLFNSLLIFPLRYYSAGYSNNASVYFEALRQFSFLHLSSALALSVWFAINLTVPMIFLLFAFTRFRHNTGDMYKDSRNRILLLYAVTGVFALLPVMGALSAPRMSCATAFAYILGVAMYQDLQKPRLVQAALGFSIVLLLAEVAIAITRPAFTIKGPRGEFAIYDQRTGEYLALIAAHARPGDRYFGDPQVSFLLGLENPSKLEWVEPNNYTRPEQVVDLVNTLALKPTRFIGWSEDCNQYQGPGDHLQILRAYLREHYHPMAAEGAGSEVLVLNFSQPERH